MPRCPSETTHYSYSRTVQRETARTVRSYSTAKNPSAAQCLNSLLLQGVRAHTNKQANGTVVYSFQLFWVPTQQKKSSRLQVRTPPNDDARVLIHFVSLYRNFLLKRIQKTSLSSEMVPCSAVMRNAQVACWCRRTRNCST